MRRKGSLAGLHQGDAWIPEAQRSRGDSGEESNSDVRPERQSSGHALGACWLSCSEARMFGSLSPRMSVMRREIKRSSTMR